MGHTTNFLAQSQQGSKPGVGELESEPGDHEGEEAGEQKRVLPALVQAHANHKPVFVLASQDCFTPPDYEIVQQHRADHGEDHAEIEAADPTDGDAAAVGGEGRVYMHPSERAFLPYL